MSAAAAAPHSSGRLDMFGYLVAHTGALTEQQAIRYRSCYCGLCRALGQHHGTLSRLTLNYDLTFIILLLGSLYEKEETSGECNCLAHPVKTHAWWRNQITDYAADMDVMLSYLKLTDDWQDDGNVAALGIAKALKKDYTRLTEKYPRQNAAMLESVAALAELERNGIEDPDAAAATTGKMMAEMLVWQEDRWSPMLRQMGDALGRFIYIMDAAMDLDDDTKSNNYNPFRQHYGLDNEQRFRDILKMLLSECVFYFDKLPIVQDSDILKNILCIGLWQKFESKFSKKKESTDESGPL